MKEKGKYRELEERNRMDDFSFLCFTGRHSQSKVDLIWFLYSWPSLRKVSEEDGSLGCKHRICSSFLST